MAERPNGDQTPSRKFFTLFIVWSMRWVMIAFPTALIIMLLLPLFVPNAFAGAPEWLGPVMAGAAPFALGLISACWVWRRGGTVSAVTEPRSDGPIWLFSAVINRWLYLIVLPVFILAAVLLGRFGVIVPARLVFAIGLGVLLLLLGVKLADGVRRLRQP